jgi:predicted Zn-dependent protease
LLIQIKETAVKIRSPLVAVLFILAACGGGTTTPQQKTTPRTQVPSTNQFMANPEAEFKRVADRVAPHAERACRRSNTKRCDFTVLVDNRYPDVVNAYQTQDRSGKPFIVFSTGLLNTAQNQDELAFVLGHELAHHLAGHISRQTASSQIGAVLGGGLAILLGGSGDTVDAVSRVGATVGARAYSKSHELEADKLGTLIAMDAGYDPVRGAAFFTRIPDPGDRFLGSHPPNAARIETVRKTAAQSRR